MLFLCSTVLFTQILLLLLSKLNSNNKICGLGFAGFMAAYVESCVNCLNKLLGDKIMCLLYLGAIYACVACYYKIQGIKEIEKKR